MENKIYINHRGTIFNPEPIEEIQWSTRLYGAGELKFKVLKDNVMDFNEGDQVTFYRNNVPIFKGYVFAKERHKNSPITVLCYDQLRYFKSKDTYSTMLWKVRRNTTGKSMFYMMILELLS